MTRPWSRTRECSAANRRRDEAALTAWRVHAGHHGAQEAGRAQVFEDYRLRVAQVVREESPGKPAWQPKKVFFTSE